MREFEREYKRFAAIVDKIDLKQKQQLVAASKHGMHSTRTASDVSLQAHCRSQLTAASVCLCLRSEHSGVADDILRDERNSVHAGSFVESALPSEQDIVFLSYDVNEIEQRCNRLASVAVSFPSFPKHSFLLHFTSLHPF